MKKYITLVTAGLFCLSLQPAGAQRQVEPPAVPPMLESGRPLAQPETKEPAAPKQAQEGKAKATAKTKAKAGKKAPKKAAATKATPKKASSKKKGPKTHKKKPPETGVKHRDGTVIS